MRWRGGQAASADGAPSETTTGGLASGRAAKGEGGTPFEWCPPFSLLLSLILVGGLTATSVFHFGALQECVHQLACVYRDYPLSQLARIFDLHSVFPGFLALCLAVTAVLILVPEAWLSWRDRPAAFGRACFLCALGYFVVSSALTTWLLADDLKDLPKYRSWPEGLPQPFHFALVWSVTGLGVGVLALAAWQFLRRTDLVLVFAAIPLLGAVVLTAVGERVLSDFNNPAPDFYPTPIWVGAAVVGAVLAHLALFLLRRRLALRVWLHHLLALCIGAWCWAFFAFVVLMFLAGYHILLYREGAGEAGGRAARLLLYACVPLWCVLAGAQVRRIVKRMRRGTGGDES